MFKLEWLMPFKLQTRHQQLPPSAQKLSVNLRNQAGDQPWEDLLLFTKLQKNPQTFSKFCYKQQIGADSQGFYNLR